MKAEIQIDNFNDRLYLELHMKIYNEAYSQLGNSLNTNLIFRLDEMLDGGVYNKIGLQLGSILERQLHEKHK